MRAPFLSIKGLHSLMQSQYSPIILDCTFVLKGPPSGYDIYRTHHIPTAKYFDIDACAVPSDLPHTYPTSDIFSKYVKRLGVKSRDDNIVLYASQGIFPAMRVWYMFKSFGHNPDKLQILEGGASEWQKSNYPIETGEQVLRDTEAKEDYGAIFADSSVVYYNDILRIIDDKHVGDEVIVDARSSGRFSGQDPEPRPHLSSGHMPNAYNIPFVDVLTPDGLGMKPVDEIKQIFESKGIKPSHRLVFSCGSGLTACVLARAADLIGHENYAIYDGSWTEYAGKKDSVIIKDGL